MLRRDEPTDAQSNQLKDLLPGKSGRTGVNKRLSRSTQYCESQAPARLGGISRNASGNGTRSLNVFGGGATTMSEAVLAKHLALSVNGG